ncbi:MAG: hypothetical protein H6564_08395 [Lewinellaceae bacterium]|nr:hypothetical protein [Lewinellaceae bacterium]
MENGEFNWQKIAYDAHTQRQKALKDIYQGRKEKGDVGLNSPVHPKNQHSPEVVQPYFKTEEFQSQKGITPFSTEP